MFILLKSGAMLNLLWVQDCFQGKHDKNIVIFYTVNGVKILEEYDTEAEATARVAEVHIAMSNAGTGGGGSGSGDVTTINGKTGNVVLSANDILTTSGNTIQTELNSLEWVEM